MYPEFSYIGIAQAQGYFNQAELYCRNCLNIVCNVNSLTMFLYTLTAHIASLFAPAANGQASSPLVGRIANASEGSVSVATEYPAVPAATWYVQTKYGAAFWEATKGYRTMRYIPGITRNMQPWPYQ